MQARSQLRHSPNAAGAPVGRPALIVSADRAVFLLSRFGVRVKGGTKKSSGRLHWLWRAREDKMRA